MKDFVLSPETKAGKALDAAIATKIMGWKFTEDKVWKTHRKKTAELPHYSTQLQAAWEVLEKMVKDGWEFEVGGAKDETFYCLLTKGRDWPMGEHKEVEVAICVAALLSVSGDPSGYWKQTNE